MKLKKSHLKSSLLLGVPVAGLLLSSCGVSRFEAVEDHELKIQVTFAEHEDRYKALKQVVDIWNELPEVKNDSNNKYLPIKLDRYLGNYTEMQSDLAKLLVTKDRNKLPNLIFNYPTTAALAFSYDMGLRFDDNPELKEAIQQTYPSNFLELNSQITGVDPNGIYTIPVVKSTRTIVASGPVINYIIEQATANGATIKAEDKAFFDTNFKKSDTDAEQIKKLWGKITKIPQDQGGFEGYEFTSDIFKYNYKLFDFALRVKKSFSKISSRGGKDSAQFVMGVDDSANLFYLSNFAKAGGKFDDFLFGLKKDGSQIDYSTLFKDKNSSRYKNAKDVFEHIKPLIETDTLFYSGRIGGDLNSNTLLNNHQLAFAIQTSSNYPKRFVANDKITTSLEISVDNTTSPIIANSKDQVYKLSKASQTNSTNILVNLDSVLVTNKQIQIITTKKPEGDNSENIYLDPQDEKDSKTIENIKKFIENKQDGNLGYLVTGKAISRTFKKVKDKSVIVSASGGSDSKDLYLIDSSKASITTRGGSETLNENEVVFLPEPIKNDPSEPKSTITYQGPDLIGIHANAEEDEAVKVFSKWLITASQTFNYKENDQEKSFTGTPSEYIAFRGFYLAPTIKNFQSDPSDKTKFPQNPLYKQLFTSFQNAYKNKEDFAIYFDPIDNNSGVFRTKISDTITQAGKQILDNEKIDFDKFLELLKRNVGSILQE
ncbi:Uncharacterized lipoprotein MPN_097 precursor [Mesomycoplasma conjunctivae]|uniref:HYPOTHETICAL Uncharacterized lipoprotein MPN_200 n=1 Tax=Mesomycoplasma conjunctivae (strain ATCC 25834 / NCTC 10147 / HRC/581) TaxID=572263 RepID=C5J5G9_MESCH|nr:P80 family lipoprotein [Mesomycoplasma conjunctivae]CAT04691.1 HYPOTHETICAL Uncharacterized lipoprotein MPN_200 [Mesomycoplasma conjunctivae]VEU65661.1 Uncharacterized lipoprotein MPN_097 precursor [Mesomycoplasma conjunctivae]